MIGLYFHIPFCKQACHYCDFHFSTSDQYFDRMVDAICMEIQLKAPQINWSEVKTVYFGGGTPSILPSRLLNKIWITLSEYLDFNQVEECTLEANPDDVNEVNLNYWKTTPINRFSIGIQSFDQKDLEWMNRAHTAEESSECIQLIKSAGFDSFSLDLIYGLPHHRLEDWERNIEKALSYEPEHISAYALTIEDKTAFGKWHQQGKLKPAKDEAVAEQFKHLIDRLNEQGYNHYEISNFAKEGKEALHNGNYWKSFEYYGFGPSAHSYYQKDSKKVRAWNLSHNIHYMNALENEEVYFESEILSEVDEFNEYIMTGLRTSKGIDLEQMRKQFKAQYIKGLLNDLKEINSQYYILENDCLRLTMEGKMISDFVISEVFQVN